METLIISLLIGAAFGLTIYTVFMRQIDDLSPDSIRLRELAPPIRKVKARKVQERTLDTELTEEQREQRKSIRMMIKQAGLSWSMRTYMTLKVAGTGMAGTVAYMLTESIPMGAVAGVYVGLTFPGNFIKWRRNKRFDKFISQFPNALDTIVRGMKSGLPLSKCLEAIAQNSPEPIRTEFQHIIDLQMLGRTLTDATSELKIRMPTPESNFFAIAISVQQSAGSSLASVLESMANIMRARKQLREKIKALSAEARMGAMIIGCLSPMLMLIIFFVSPGYLDPLFTTSTGKFALGVGAVMMFIGITVMRRMIRFKI